MDSNTTAVMFATGNDTVATPDYLFKELDNEFHFDVDLAATKDNRKVESYIGPDHEDVYRRDLIDGSYTDVFHERGAGLRWWKPRPPQACWLNPPYSRREHACPPDYSKCTKKRCKKRGYHIDSDKPGLEDFVKVAWMLPHQHQATVVCLLPARTDCAWWHIHVWDNTKNAPRQNVEVRFLRGRVKFEGQDAGAPFPSVIVIFRPKLA